MIKIVLIALLLVVELIVFYKVDPSFAYPFRGIIHLYMAYWYYSERKNSINLTDKLFIVSCLVPALTPIPIYIFGFSWGTMLEVVMLLVSYQLLIRIYTLEGAKIRLKNNQKTFVKVLIPFVLFPLSYFLFVVLSAIRGDVLTVFCIYLLQIMYMSVLSAYLPYPEKSKLYLSLGMFFILFASGASFQRVYVSSYNFDYGIMRIAANLGRMLIIIGLINRLNVEVRLPPKFL